MENTKKVYINYYYNRKPESRSTVYPPQPSESALSFLRKLGKSYNLLRI